jgi:hypothetical protein
VIKSSCTHEETLTLFDFDDMVERNFCKGCFKIFWVKTKNAGSENQPFIASVSGLKPPKKPGS